MSKIVRIGILQKMLEQSKTTEESFISPDLWPPIVVCPPVFPKAPSSDLRAGNAPLDEGSFSWVGEVVWALAIREEQCQGMRDSGSTYKVT